MIGHALHSPTLRLSTIFPRINRLSHVKASETVRRKTDHIYAALHGDVEFHTVTAGFERYAFVHQALPEIDRSEVDTSVTLFGRRLSMPLIISPMTGGTEEATHYNRMFAEVAQQFGLAMGVGSQRAAIEDPTLAYTYQVRDIAPDILLLANLGAVQLNNGCGVDSCIEAVEMIRADALMLHLNPLQECIQPGGNTNFRDLAARIADVCETIDMPVIVKEVGHGISAQAASLLVEAGVSGIDVAGAGGTSWAKVESLRGGDPMLSALGEWGIPTVDSLLAVQEAAPRVVVIASGGVRTGQDIAKALTLGADAVGIALPLLRCAATSRSALHEKIEELREELVTVMFCAGARKIESLTRSI